MNSDPSLGIGDLLEEFDAHVSQEAPLQTGEEAGPKAEVPRIGEQEGEQIGPYRLLNCLGEGGFGSVWRAEQEAPVKRLVALKILKLGMDTREVMARFGQEKQALAMMDHPCIARVLDAGATATGRPYFAMELVSGVAITRYCDERQLKTRERLKIFVDVCRAVQHAHQKGVIHRDIKPANVLVSDGDSPQVKVIDFGIAKAISGETLAELTIVTLANRFIGTPAYMSPEQLTGGSDVDTRTDVYSLGVLLFELLTGGVPFPPEDWMTRDSERLMRRIRDWPPPKPSTHFKTQTADKLHTIAENRGSLPPELSRQLRGDLDWIVLKALEKDPARRYVTPSELAADVERYLIHQPIVARPPSRTYLARQFTRRHKAAVISGLGIAAALALGLAASLMLYFREREARALADMEAEKSRQVSAFLRETLAAAGISKAKGRDATMMREILESTEERIGTELSDQPEVEAELREIVGKTYRDLDEYAKAEEQLARALTLRRSLFPGNSPELASALVEMGEAVLRARSPAAAEPFARESLEIRRQLYGLDDPLVVESEMLMGWILAKTGRAKEALDMAQHAFSLWIKNPENPHLSEAPPTLSLVYCSTGQQEESLAVSLKELEILRHVLGPEDPALVRCLDNLGVSFVKLHRFDEGEKYLLESLEMAPRFFGDRNPFEDHVYWHLSVIAANRGDLEKELSYSRTSMVSADRVFEPGNLFRKQARDRLAAVLLKQAKVFLNRAEEAKKASGSETAFRESVANANQRLEELAKLDQAHANLKVDRKLWDSLSAKLEDLGFPLELQTSVSPSAAPVVHSP